MCFVQISEQTETFTLYIIKWLAFITEVERFYCAVCTEFLYESDYFSSSNGLTKYSNNICAFVLCETGRKKVLN
jgi:hypothetical protein